MDDFQQKHLQTRPANSRDERWLWHLYSALLKPFIDQQWGWDETVQRSNFKTHLPYSMFTILETKDSALASYAVQTEQQHIYLHMLLVPSEHQLQGIGTHVLNTLKAQAASKNLPIELSVFPANPVTPFYKKNGFSVIEETQDKIRFRWQPR